MKGITKSIIEHYHYGSEADDLKREYTELLQYYQKLSRGIIFELDTKKSKRMRLRATVVSKRLNKLK